MTISPPQLSVSDSTLKEFHETFMEDARLAAKKAMVVSLTVSHTVCCQSEMLVLSCPDLYG